MNTDPRLWTTRRAFGVAGGPDEIVLTDEGSARAFSVGAQVRLGDTAKALETLHSSGGEGMLVVRVPGSAKLALTELGRRFDQHAWGRLRWLGYVESIQNGDGVRLTDDGRLAVRKGFEERERLLERCKKAAVAT